jgi:hypothetical protein
MPKEKKRIPAHKRAIELLEEDPIRNFDTLMELYKSGTVIVPVKEIPYLIAAFVKAEKAISKADMKSILMVSNALKRQQCEV